jgi:uncharacterized protein
MEASATFSTKLGNNYVFDNNKKDLLLCHPHFSKVIDFCMAGHDFAKIIEIEKPVIPKELANIPISDLKYYFQKYTYLKNSGYFEVKNKNLNEKLNSTDIEQAIANSNQLTFEVTERCNLSCDYCGYGKYYNGYDKRENQDLDINIAKNFIDFIIKKKNSSINQSHNQVFYISFYGGEPLLAIQFVREILRYTKQSNFNHNKVVFSMTTNAVLLHRYMDFLAENEIELLISLDGDRKSNTYRKFKNNKESFTKIYENLKLLQNKYPDYFENRVRFNSVLHNNNSVDEIYNFFKYEFSKRPDISELNTVGIKENKKEEFYTKYKYYYHGITESGNFKQLEDELFIDMPHIRSQAMFLKNMTKTCFNTYNDLLYNLDKQERMPTGTCLPFSKKIFLTVKGKILPCEKIDQKYSLGFVNHKQVKIDNDEIARKYNTYLAKITGLCEKCMISDYCTQCFFNLNIDADKVVCNGFTDNSKYKNRLSGIFSSLEERPVNVLKITKEVNFSS